MSSNPLGMTFPKTNRADQGPDVEHTVSRNGRDDKVTAPGSWSSTAVEVAASRFLYGREGDVYHETSIVEMINRVVGAIHKYGERVGYFKDDDNAANFKHALTDLLASQTASFNSPVWFNVGLGEKGVRGDSSGYYWSFVGNEAVKIPKGKAYDHPQASACFILQVDDSMEAILDAVKVEGTLFKYGSGVGESLSRLRSTREYLSGGGRPSGPLSFFKLLDSTAGAIKSGGKTRRAARINNLAVNHPDIAEFITCKAIEERKINALVAAGFSPGMDGQANTTAAYQSTNISLWASDKFMEKARTSNDDAWRTVAVTTGRDDDGRGGSMPVYSAHALLRSAAQACWECGDPGLQFDDTINAYNTVAATAKIESSNPCGEFLFINNTACNLASINLIKFLRDDGSFDFDKFIDCVRVMITAMDILVDLAGYPTAAICENSHNLRPLGLGFANLGGLLMAVGLPYDSEAARQIAATIAAVMQAAAASTSAMLSRVVGSFDGLHNKQHDNRSFLNAVAQKHYSDGSEAVSAVLSSIHDVVTRWIGSANVEALVEGLWDDVFEEGGDAVVRGIRNAQLTCIAPTGTIALTMDCATTGIEPEIALVRDKHLAGGGSMRLVNPLVRRALTALGYDPDAVAEIADAIQRSGSAIGVGRLLEEHKDVFATAFGNNPINPRGHIAMVAAVQPHISGGISKTINVPNTTTVDTIVELFLTAYRLGCKSITIYRDGSKGAQPVVAVSGKDDADAPSASPRGEAAVDAVDRQDRRDAVRVKLPPVRPGVLHHFEISGHDGYLAIGQYDDGRPAELFINMAKQGSTIAGLMDTIGILTSFLLQYGVPLKVLCHKLVGSRFDPAGFTRTRDVPMASSIIDYVFRWLGARYVDGGKQLWTVAEDGEDHQTAGERRTEAPACPNCGALMEGNGRCYLCRSCGETTGGCG